MRRYCVCYCCECYNRFDLIRFQGGYYILGYFYPGGYCAPSLLIGLINMFMMKPRESGFVEGNVPGGKVLQNCHLNYWYPGQVNLFKTREGWKGGGGGARRGKERETILCFGNEKNAPSERYDLHRNQPKIDVKRGRVTCEY